VPIAGCQLERIDDAQKLGSFPQALTIFPIRSWSIAATTQDFSGRSLDGSVFSSRLAAALRQEFGKTENERASATETEDVGCVDRVCGGRASSIASRPALENNGSVSFHLVSFVRDRATGVKKLNDARANNARSVAGVNRIVCRGAMAPTT
jgi:hypothetical protein